MFAWGRCITIPTLSTQFVVPMFKHPREFHPILRDATKSRRTEYKYSLDHGKFGRRIMNIILNYLCIIVQMRNESQLENTNEFNGIAVYSTSFKRFLDLLFLLFYFPSEQTYNIHPKYTIYIAGSYVVYIRLYFWSMLIWQRGYCGKAISVCVKCYQLLYTHNFSLLALLFLFRCLRCMHILSPAICVWNA